MSEHVFKRGQEMWEDEQGFHKVLVESNEPQPEPPVPDYLQLHEAVLKGGDPIELQREFADREQPTVQEAKMPAVEKNVNTSSNTGSASTSFAPQTVPDQPVPE